MEKCRLFINCSVLTLVLGSCGSVQDKLLDKVLIDAGENASELQRVLDHYDDERSEVAEWLVTYMNGRYGIRGESIDSIEHVYTELPNNGIWDFDSTQLSRAKRFYELPRKIERDVSTIDSKYLISHIDDSWNLKNCMKWNKNLSTEDFRELILPYRSGDEIPTSWREAYRARYDSIAGKVSECDNSVDAARIISEAIGEAHYNNQLRSPHRTATRLLETPVGYCRDDCDRTLYAMRAFGVPVAVDELLASPDNGISHEWNVVYDTENHTYRMFDNNRFPPTRDSVHNDNRRKGKVYRRTWSVNPDRLEKYKGLKDVPKELLDPHHKDVTAQYFGRNRVEVEVGSNNPVYLGIFTPEEYKPIDIAEKQGETAVFENTEPNVIYFPISREDIQDKRFSPCGMPFLVKSDGEVHQFIPDADCMEDVCLNRKTAVWFHQKERLAFFVGCKMQIGKSESGPWRDIDSIGEPLKSSFYRIPLSDYNGERFIRFLASKYQRCQLSEMIVSTDSLAVDRLPMTLITYEPAIGKDILLDGDILGWVKYNKQHKPLVFRIDSDKTPDSIFVVSRNDDNYVMPGEEYELFYYSIDGWKSLGKKVAEDFKISFKAPANAVLWLRNLTKGREEQVFIWRNNRQIFNTNMSAYTTY